MALFDNKEKTNIENLGEFGLIDHLTKNIKLTQKSTTKGVGDDAAVLDFEGKKVLVSTDMLLEGIHFDLAYTPLKHLGYKAVQVNLSDIYAMNAAQVAADYAVGPEVVPDNSLMLSLVQTGNDIVLEWPLAATGYTVQTSGTLGPDAIWKPLPEGTA